MSNFNKNWDNMWKLIFFLSAIGIISFFYFLVRLVMWIIDHVRFDL